MANKVFLTNSQVVDLAEGAANLLTGILFRSRTQPVKLFGVPRGGIPAVYAVQAAMAKLYPETPVALVEDASDADAIIDDIVDSGATRELYCDESPGGPVFLSLIDKTESDCTFKDSWVVFPWEGDAESGIEDNIRRIIQFAGDDPNRGGLLETPHRVAKALGHWFGGYAMDPKDVLKVFEDGAEGYDEMVVVKDIPFYSKCEHHMADIFGTATIAYIPDGKIVGLSKLSRLLDIFARRLQVQERLTHQVANALEEHLSPKGVGVVIRARHMCMESRGVCQQGHHTITSALRGVIKDSPEARAEFMNLER